MPRETESEMEADVQMVREAMKQPPHMLSPCAEGSPPEGWGHLNGINNEEEMAERTGLEPATPGVTGRYSNQLNYRSAL
jgi:hypothetical protein